MKSETLTFNNDTIAIELAKGSMMKTRFAAAALLAMSLCAHAQFIDERAQKPVTATAAHGASASASVPTAPSAQFDVLAGDDTIRGVLVRWSSVNGWIFKAEHWNIDRDLPISGVADASQFGSDYKDAVRKLLSSTELTDRALQPCFYSNRVLRVVPKAELCDKTSAINK